jgi:hypothetical protein
LKESPDRVPLGIKGFKLIEYQYGMPSNQDHTR